MTESAISVIQRIRKRLWDTDPRRGNRGRASVMIGAGFSRNAKPQNSGARPLPLWSELSDRLREQLTCSTEISVLDIASDYIKQRQSGHELDDLLEKLIPDHQYNPGYAHQLLVELPWADIFTTNFDRLLERANVQFGNRYSLVKKTSDLPSQAPPRVIKLHGSFPDGDYIIANEHYVEYPTKYAPFVSTAVQSMLENEFVLLGFSGDDPNFQSWRKWVVQSLGFDAMPWVYLVGVFDFDDTKIEEFAKKKVKVVDLAEQFPRHKFPAGSDHRHCDAITWFLQQLEQVTIDLQNWPDRHQLLKPGTASERFSEIPTFIQAPRQVGNSPNDEELKLAPNDYLQKAILNWKNDRLSYPGWLVPPLHAAEKLWEYTERWVDPLLTTVPVWLPRERLAALYELAWRYRNSLLPISPRAANEISRTLCQYNPFGEECAEEVKQDYHLWQERCGEWVFLAFALLTHYRQQFLLKHWMFWFQKVRAIPNKRVEWKAQLSFEEVLHNINVHQWDAVWSVLERWEETPELPEWELKRALLYAEYYCADKAQQIIGQCMERLQRENEHGLDQFKIRSTQGWLWFVCERLFQARDFTVSRLDTNWKEAEYRKNRLALRPIDCDPKQLLREYSQAFEHEHRQELLSTNSKEYLAKKTEIAALRLLSLLEYGFAPYKALQGNSSTSVEASVLAKLPFADTQKYLLQKHPAYIIGSTYRMRSNADFHYSEAFQQLDRKIFTKKTLYRIENLVANTISILQKEFRPKAPDINIHLGNPLRSDSAFVHAFTHLFTIYHALYPFLPREANRTRALVLTCFGINRLPRGPSYHLSQTLQGLCFDIIATADADWIGKNLIYFNDLPIYGLADWQDESHIDRAGVPRSPLCMYRYAMFSFDGGAFGRWVDPFWYLYDQFGFQLRLPDPKSARPLITINGIQQRNEIRFIIGAALNEGLARESALLRLSLLHFWQGLTNEETELFGKVLWERVNKMIGLPQDFPLPELLLLSLPHPSNIKVKAKLRKFYQSLQLPEMLTDSPTFLDPAQLEVTSTMNRWKAERPLLCLLFAYKQAKIDDISFADVGLDPQKFIDQITTWWNNQKAFATDKTTKLTFHGETPYDVLQGQIEILSATVSYAFTSNAARLPASEHALLSKIIEEWKMLGFPIPEFDTSPQ